MGSGGHGEYLIDVPAGEAYEHDFELPRGEVRGRVVDERGRPVADARLSLLLVRGVAERGAMRVEDDSAVTGDDGSFTLDGLSAGTYQIGGAHERLAATALPPLTLGEH